MYDLTSASQGVSAHKVLDKIFDIFCYAIILLIILLIWIYYIAVGLVPGVLHHVMEAGLLSETRLMKILINLYSQYNTSNAMYGLVSKILDVSMEE